MSLLQYLQSSGLLILNTTSFIGDPQNLQTIHIWQEKSIIFIKASKENGIMKSYAWKYLAHNYKEKTIYVIHCS